MASTDRSHIDAARTRGGAHPAIMISLLAVIVILIVVVGVGLAQKGDGGGQKEPPKDTTNEDQFKEIMRKINQADRMKQEAMKLRTQDDKQEEFQAKINETLEFVIALQDEWNAMLEPVKREDGTLPPEFEGYQSDAERLNYLKLDLMKQASF